MAETKVINLEVKTNIDSAAKSFDKLGKSIDNTEKSVDNLNLTFDEVYGDLKPLTARMGEAEDRLYELGLAGKQATDEYKGLLNAVGNYRKVQIQTDLVVDAAAQTVGQKLGASLQGATSAFTGVQGAMGLIGVESEGLQKALLRVQSAMALSEGLKGIREAFPAFKNLAAVIGQTAVGQKLLNVAQVVGATVMKALNFVMKQNPILLIVSGIIAAVAAFKFFTQSADSATLAQEELNRKQEDSIRLLKQSQTEIDNYTSKLNTSSKNKIALAKAEGANSEEIFQLEKARLEEEIRYRKLMHDSGVKLTAEQYAQQKQAKFDLQILEAQHNTDLAKLKQEEADKDKVIRDKKTADSKDALDKIALNEEAAFEKKKADRIAQQVQDAQDLIDAKKFDEDKHTAEVAALQKSVDARKEANAKKVEDDKARVQKEIELENSTRQQKLQMASSALSILSDATSLFTARNEKDARNQFKINKALSLSSAIVNTALAVTGALTAGGNPIKLATGMQFVEAGFAAASGAVSIAKISATQYSGGSFGAADKVATPSAATNQAVTPNFNIVGNNGLNQLSQLKQGPIQAYVVSGQVSTAQSLDRNRVRNATL